jgi:hypothetical protein
MKFRLAARERATNFVEDSWPPEVDLEWSYQPRPPDETQEPLQDGKYMAHLFRNPHESLLFQASMSLRLRMYRVARYLVEMAEVTFTGIRLPHVRDDPTRPMEPPIRPTYSQWVYHSTPKKVGKQLTVKVERPQMPASGWGLRFEEGFRLPYVVRFGLNAATILVPLGISVAGIVLVVRYGWKILGVPGAVIALLGFVIAAAKTITS